MFKSLRLGIALLVVLALASCGGSEYQKYSLDQVIKTLPENQPWSIILYDMNVEGSFFKEYQHKYKVILEGDSLPTSQETEWYAVSKNEFRANVDNMGMEIAHRDRNGKLHKSVNPPGYSNYVGNSRYGRWNQRNGTSFWEFYGQYAFMSSMFNMMAYPVRRSYYDDYYTNYYNTGRSYYGPTNNGSYYYGTYSKYNNSQNNSSRWHSRSANSRYAERVSSRTSRSSSRYGSSSSRSRGGGFGK